MNKKDPKNYFDSDDSMSDEEEVAKAEVLKTSKPWQENFDSYLKYFKDYIHKCEQLQSDLFHNGSKHVNHPLMQFTMLNFEKNVGLFDLLKLNQNSEQIFERTAILFSYLQIEVNKVKETLESSLLESLVMYGERAPNVELAEGEAELQTARMMSVYKRIYNSIKKLMTYVQHTIVQTHCIFNKKEPQYKLLFKNVSPYMPIEIIGRSLRLIYLLDRAVTSNPYILEHWNLYKKLVRMVKSEPDKFGVQAHAAKKLEKLTLRLDNTLLSGNCFEKVVSMTYDKFFETNRQDIGLFKNNKEMKEFLELYFEETIKKLMDGIAESVERDKRTILLEVMCVYAFYRKIYPGDQLRDVWKNLWQLQKTMPIIQGFSHVTVYVWEFLMGVCPLSRPSKTRDPKDPQQYLKSYTEQLDKEVAGDIGALYTQCCIWVSRMESIVTSNYSISADVEKVKEKSPEKVNDIIIERLNNRLHLLTTALQLAGKLRRVVYICMMLHVDQEIAFSKSILGHLILGLESMKAIQQLCRDKSDAFDTTLLTKLVGREIDKIVRPYYERINKQESAKKKPDRLEYVSALRTILRLMATPITTLKLAVLHYSVCFVAKILPVAETNELFRLLGRLSTINHRTLILSKLTDCSFLYSCKQILTSFFEFKRSHPTSCKRLQLLFNSFEDSSQMISKCGHLQNQKEVFLSYKQFVLGEFEKCYMRPLKREIEDFLRINIHFMLIDKIQGQNPFKSQTKDLLKLVHLQKLRIFDSIIDIKTQITKSFNQTFYNINVINMYDMQTYQQIRTMGNYLFGLDLQNVYLPSQTIDQNFFDILQVLRTIPTFVQRYKYNIFTQTFLELTGESKQVSSIGIKQLSDSIKTHGLGILSTTVNAFYRFLIKKVKGFSKFLFDDYIQSPLVAEKNWLKKVVEREDYPGYYPYERAELFYDKIKKLGRLEDQKTFLDRFRMLITSVGNVLGFVRLLRSASLNFTSKSVEFLPKKLQLEDKIADIATRTTLSEVSVEACGELDDIFKSLEDSFTDRTDYLSVLMKSFRKISASKHLKLFYLMVPALTINYVQNTLIGKQQINKRISTRAFISDDGFVLGLAYFLALLKQNQHYQALHWRTAVSTKFRNDIEQNKDFTQRNDKSKKVNDDINMLKQLSLRMLNMQKDEFEMFDYTLTAAKILFKEQQDDAEKADPGQVAAEEPQPAPPPPV